MDGQAITTDTRKRVLLGQPAYGGITEGAALGFYMASLKPDRLRVSRAAVNNSLLAHSFNLIWCRALNLKREEGLDYFAMIHADVEPPAGWLDVLIEEMEARDLDVLGVAVAIKDPRGLTSTALSRDDDDPWRTHCRLTTRELHRLPETFTSEDVGGRKILLNTGLWVCRFGDWADKVHFTVNDRIIKGDDGRYHTQVEPEDWFFSRLLHEQNLKIGCTRKVEANHRGLALYPNSVPWGRFEFDKTHLDRSVLDADPGPDWFPREAAGWLSAAEGRELARLAEGKAVLEVGSYCGRSTVCLARTARTVVAVDTFDGRGTPAPADTFETFKKNLERYGVADKVGAVYRQPAAEALPRLPAVFDLAFIDAAHDYQNVMADATNAARCLRPGGLLAFHDYENGRDPGVDRAVNELLANGATLLGRVDSLAVVRPAATPDLTTTTPLGA